MKNLAQIKSIIGVEKTLVITCYETELEGDEGLQEQVFTFLLTHSGLKGKEYLQGECIRYFIENKKCTQIIVAGKPTEPEQDEAPGSALSWFQFNLAPLFRSKDEIFSDPYLQRVINDLAVIRQSRQLMDYEFIQERIKRKALKLVGVSVEADGSVRKLFRNGVVYNDLVTSN